MTTTPATMDHRAPRPLAEHDRAAIEMLDAGSDGVVRVRVHDATRFEWAISIPLPERGHLAYSIEVELEVPTNAVVRRSPWEQIQTFTRLDEVHRPEPREVPTIDALRRGAVSLRRMLTRAASGFARHVAMGAQREAEDTEGDPYGFLVIWLETALYAVAEVRRRLTQPAPGDTSQVARERALVDEYASVALLDMLVDASLTVSPRRCHPAPEALVGAFERVRARIDDAIADEIAYRRASGFLTMIEPSPTALDTYVARAARLKKHFEEVLFLDRESYQLDERVQQWMASLAALFAGGLAFVLQLALLDERSSKASIGSHLLVIAAIAGACYMARDRLKDLARTWLTGKVHRFHAQRVSRYRLPERMLATRDVFMRTREWCNQSTQSLPDVLNPEGGATLTRTRIRYLQKGVVASRECLAGAGVSRVRHIARYDVSPLLPRLADDIKRVPFVDADGAVHVSEVPRRYQIPVSVRFHHGGKAHEERATLVLEKRGITRMDKGTARDSFSHDAFEEAAEEA